MASSPPADDGAELFDEFLSSRGHEIPEEWEREHRKKQCPECHGLHELSAASCSICGWSPII